MRSTPPSLVTGTPKMGEVALVELPGQCRQVYVQYCTCKSSILCVRVLGYVPDDSASRPVDMGKLERIPDRSKPEIRRHLIRYFRQRFGMETPLVQF